MIDWVTVEIPFLHLPIDSGFVCKVLPGGELDWQSPCRMSVEGSYSSSITIKSIGGDGTGRATHLRLSGNPSKFLQGHNVFGSDHILPLVYDTFIRVCSSLNFVPRLSELRSVKRGDYDVINIDINQSYELPTRSDCIAFIRALEFKAKTRHGRPSMKGGTLYFGAGGTRWKVKIYCKGEELDSRKRGHKLARGLDTTPIKQWADNKVRIELTLLSKELKEKGIGKARDFTVSLINELYSQYLRRIEMSEQIALSSQAQNDLPTNLQSTYLHWVNGVDLRGVLSKATFYRQRRLLMDLKGIDISLTKEIADRTNVVPLVRILEAKPAQIPSWAFDLGLVHPSARAAS